MSAVGGCAGVDPGVEKKRRPPSPPLPPGLSQGPGRCHRGRDVVTGAGTLSEGPGRCQRGRDVVRGAGTLSQGPGNSQGGGDVVTEEVTLSLKRSHCG